MKKTPDYEEMQSLLEAAKAEHDAQIAQLVLRDTSIINGLLREIDALHLLLRKQSVCGCMEAEPLPDGCPQIYDVRNTRK